ncbi:MAG: DUF1653 domain-containing protein [Clostridia bacterium]|nr:DUF1653 domain-containing protein [Clostridia bacterium]
MIEAGQVAPHIIHHLKRVRPQLEFFLSPALKPGRYRHFKGGLYDLLYLGRHSETEEPMVVYRSLSEGGIWVRPADLWGEMVPFEGGCIPRFAPVEE